MLVDPKDVTPELVKELPHELNGRKMGALLDPVDTRDILYSPDMMRLARGIKAPPPKPRSKDLRSKCPPVYDQGQLGSCVSQSTTFCAHFEQWRQKEKILPGLSALYNYYKNREAQGTIDEDSGSSVRQGFKSAAAGTPPNPYWPYDLSHWKTPPSAEAVAQATHHKALIYLSIPVKPDHSHLEVIKSSIAEGYPVAFAMLVYDNFDPDSSGRIPLPDPVVNQLVGGHSMAIVGYSDYSEVFIIRNSWSDKWGGYRRGGNVVWGGYAKISYAMMALYASDFWTLRSLEVNLATLPTVAEKAHIERA